ncbi:MAG: hypothetical protein LCH69_15985 [Proteobacteria bacterium]|nr:hypothetical protein [Pseudomonadota bacterium]
MADLTLVIDRGTTNVKASLFDRDLNQVAVATERNPVPNYPAPCWAESDMDALWEVACSAVCQLWTDGNDPKAVRAVVVAGQGDGLMLLDGSGQPVRPVIMSLDARANGLLDEWRADGRYDMVFQTARMVIRACSALALLAWMDRHEPQSLETARHLLFAKDWFRFRLTGDIATDLTDASVSCLIDAATGGYATGMFGKLGLGHLTRLFPPLRSSAEEAGQITGEAAAALGLPAGLPVFTGANDNCAGHGGLATLSPKAAAVIFGTWVVDLFIVAKDSPAPVIMSHPEPGHFLSGVGDNNAGTVLDGMIGLLYGTEPGLAADAYGRAETDAATAPPSRLLFVPHLFGHAFDGAATGSFLGLDGRTSRQGLIRAVYEGLVLSNCAYLATCLDTDALEEIWLAGGGAKSRVLGQILADALGRPVHVARDSEMVGRGAAISALIGLGELKGFADAPRPVIGRTFAPQPAMKAYYAQKLAMLGGLMQSGNPLARQLAEISLPETHGAARV